MLLEVNSINAGYGHLQVLFDLSFSIAPGEVVTLLGRNGMGKTTTIHALMGIVGIAQGVVKFNGVTISGLSPHRISQMGIGLVPEGRQIFPNLTVRENLQMAFRPRTDRYDKWTLERVLDLFPRLKERLTLLGTKLSGGEQQMLAIGRALMTNPSLLVLDEATEGLAPVICDDIWKCLKLLKDAGLSILVIDKDVEAMSAIANRHYVMEKGQIAWSGDNIALTPAVVDRWLSI